MESFEWVIGLLTVIFGIAGIANNNKKKRQEQASSAAGRKPPASTGRTRPVGGTFGKILEELSRQLEDEQPSPTATPSWPVARPAARPSGPDATVSTPSAATQPEATSHDYYSLEGEYDTMEGYAWHRDYNAEESDAESRYVGGEMGDRRYGHDGYEEDVVEEIMTERERFLARISARPTTPTAVNAASAVEAVETGATATGISSPDPDDVDTPATMRELLGGDFDLRRAVIEAEILTPKYI